MLWNRGGLNRTAVPNSLTKVIISYTLFALAINSIDAFLKEIAESVITHAILIKVEKISPR
jgi:hypothetical protein